MRKLPYNLRIRRGLLISLISVAALVSAVTVVGSGVLDNTIRRRLSRMIKNKDAELQELIAAADSSSHNGKPREAIGLYLTALTRNPSEQRRHKHSELKQRARIGLSQSLAKIGKYGRAKDIAMTVAREEPEYWYAYKNVADILADSGKPDKAIEFYRSALQINPTDLDTVSVLVEIFEEGGQRDEVVALCRRYLEAYALGSLKLWLDGTKVHECNVLVNGTRQRIRIPYPGNGRLRLQCELEGQPLEVWLGDVQPLDHDPMAVMFLEHGLLSAQDIAKGDILQMRIGTKPAIDVTTNVAFDAATNFLSLDLVLSKPWTDDLTRTLRKAMTGNPR